MKKSNKIIALTGGGTAGHITPNLAIYEELKNRNYNVIYIGTSKGMEKGMVENNNIPFFSISSEKFRRYIDIKNLLTPFYVVKGIFEARKILKKEKVDIIFSKGGYVSTPVVIAGHFLKIPIISHEADLTPGLANKINLPFSNIICTNFYETSMLIKKKAVWTGCPIRKKILSGDKEKAKKMFNFKTEKSILLVIGGSLGSININNMIRENLDFLINKFNIIHICGKNKISYKYQEGNGYSAKYKYDSYRQFELVIDELPDIYAYSDLIISRAGANVMFEILALKKPNLLIPLSLNASRGDQILNAKTFEKYGYSKYLLEDDYYKNKKLFIERINEIYDNQNTFINNMNNSKVIDSAKKICNIIEEILSHKGETNEI